MLAWVHRQKLLLGSAILGLLVCGCGTPMKREPFKLDYSSQTDPYLQLQLEEIHTALLTRHGIADTQAASGILDLQRNRLALIHPDRLFYGASVPKIVILLAYFELTPHAVSQLDDLTRHELGLMIKISSNELAAKYSQQLGLSNILEVIKHYHLYDARQGGGLWMGKHYGVSGERRGDPVGDHSHTATVRQVMRFLLLMEQGKLVSEEASQTMREIFESPAIPHQEIKFVQGLAGREVNVLRKSGSWENWLHDAAIVEGQGRHYILVGLTENPRGDAFLEDLAREADTILGPRQDLIYGK